MEWTEELLGALLPAEGRPLQSGRQTFSMRDGILRDSAIYGADQAQTRDMFAFKWAQRSSYGTAANAEALRSWLVERYGDLGAGLRDGALVLDAGCGAGYAASLLFRNHFKRLRYVGVDISTAVEIARASLAPLAGESLFLQGDLDALPFRPHAFDLVVSEGVMHHTPSTKRAFDALVKQVKPGGVFGFYVYAKKAPVREFTDDYVRSLLADMAPRDAWDALRPLTELGRAIGELNAEIDVPSEIALLGVPKGRISVQRLFYYYVCKAYYRPDFTFDEMNHINFDWFTPKYCHRQTPEEVRAWCEGAGLHVVKFASELSGITVVAEAPR